MLMFSAPLLLNKNNLPFIQVFLTQGESVSYTHLDVYKRQVYAKPTFLFSRILHSLNCFWSMKSRGIVQVIPNFSLICSAYSGNVRVLCSATLRSHAAVPEEEKEEPQPMTRIMSPSRQNDVTFFMI